MLFFLESPPSKDPARRIQKQRQEWEFALDALNAHGAATWHLGEGWPLLRAARDMSTLIDEADQTAAMTAFFRERITAAKRLGLIERYLAALT